MLTKAQRINRAMERMEEAAMDLINQAEKLSPSLSLWDQNILRRGLLERARRYGRTVSALTRVRK